MKTIIYVGWAHSLSDPNFGDEIAPYIIGKIANYKIIYVPALRSRLHLFLLIVKRIIYFKFEEVFHYSRILLGKKFYLTVGSILQFYKLNGGIVWGSGLIDQKLKTGKHKYCAVRGPITRKTLLMQGNFVPEVYGDPAILLKRFYDSPKIIKYNIGIIPHIVHFESFAATYLSSDFRIINLKTTEIESVIDDIRECKLILSSSLHGIIVAHTYGVPAIWMSIDGEQLMGDNMKFVDYFLSVGIEPYLPVSQNEVLYNDSMTKVLKRYELKLLPNIDLTVMSDNLFDAMPF